MPAQQCGVSNQQEGGSGRLGTDATGLGASVLQAVALPRSEAGDGNKQVEACSQPCILSQPPSEMAPGGVSQTVGLSGYSGELSQELPLLSLGLLSSSAPRGQPPLLRQRPSSLALASPQEPSQGRTLRQRAEAAAAATQLELARSAAKLGQTDVRWVSIEAAYMQASETIMRILTD